MQARVQAWRDAGREMQYRDHRVFYRDEGVGSPLLLLHGFPTSSFDWRPIWNELIQRHRVIAPDFLGYGLSDKPRDHEYSILDQADLVEALLRELGIERCGILAHDYGDTVAQELLARFLEIGASQGSRYTYCCLLNGGLFPEVHRPRLIQKLLLSPLGFLVARLVNERSFRKSFSAIFGPQTQPGERELAEFWELIEREGGARIYHKLIRYIPERKRFRQRWVGALQNAGIPLRFINGLEDPVSGRHMVQRYRELIPRADVVELPGIGHYPQTEAPQLALEAFNELVQRAG